MLCDQCKQNPATYHYTHIVNGQKSEAHLCQECLQKQSAGGVNQVSNLFSGLLGRTPPADVPRCSQCGLDFRRFQQTGLLGCAQCYHDFHQQLEPMLKRIHGQVQHQGHVPQSAAESLKVRRRMDALQEEMKQAVQEENFERAAELRDQIRITQGELDALRQPQTQETPVEADAPTDITEKEGETHA